MTVDPHLEAVAVYEKLRAEVEALRRDLEGLSRRRASAGPRGFGTGLAVGAALGGTLGWIVFLMFRDAPKWMGGG